MDPINTEARPDDAVQASVASGADAPTATITDAEDGAAPVAVAEPDLAAERDAAQKQAQEYLALAQRTQADFQNYKRRMDQESVEVQGRARGEVVEQFLPVLDDFERALSVLPPERQDEEWLQGFRLIERKLRSTLENLGVERIVAEGQPFDPREHEAVMQEARDDVEPGTVASVLRQGYRQGKRVLRPAQVVVAQ